MDGRERIWSLLVWEKRIEWRRVICCSKMAERKNRGRLTKTSRIDLNTCFWKLKYPEKTHTHLERIWKSHMERWWCLASLAVYHLFTFNFISQKLCQKWAWLWSPQTLPQSCWDAFFLVIRGSPLTDDMQMASPWSARLFYWVCTQTDAHACLHIKIQSSGHSKPRAQRRNKLLTTEIGIMSDLDPLWNSSHLSAACEETCSAQSCLVSTLSHGWMELGGLHGPGGADRCGLLPGKHVGGVCRVRGRAGLPPGAHLLLPHLPGRGRLPGGRGRRAPGRAIGWLGGFDLWPLPAPQLCGAGADPGLGAVAARHRRGPIPALTHTAQVRVLLWIWIHACWGELEYI